MKRLLIIGCGDVALRAASALHRRYRLYALSRDPEQRPRLRALGIVPIAGDLDRPLTLDRLAGLADAVLHFAPPAATGNADLRTARLLAAFSKGESLPQRLVYISTSGVYGDCGGEWVTETRKLRPGTPRAQRRADAERRLRNWGRRNSVTVTLLRAPGIYAANRLPVERLRRGTPVLAADEDPYTNHIHADDLARIALAALRRGLPGRAYNACDDSEMKMGEYFDRVADHFGLPRPPRISRAAAPAALPASLLSFMEESRRLSNRRIKAELKIRLDYPTVDAGLATAAAHSE